MDLETIFTGMPFWELLVFTVLVVLLAVVIGARLGRIAARAADKESTASVGLMVSAVMGMLALLLGFTFGVAANRLADRKQMVLNEANAIGTTYLRARLLPQPESDAIQELLRRYARARVAAMQSGRVAPAIAESERVHELLWEQTQSLARRHPESIILGTFILSLNEMIDAHESRLQIGLRDRVPAAIWICIYFVTILAMSGMGYYFAITEWARPVVFALLTLAFCAVILLIADLDRPGEGLLLVSQAPTQDVLRMMMQGATGY